MRAAHAHAHALAQQLVIALAIRNALAFDRSINRLTQLVTCSSRSTHSYVAREANVVH